MGLGLSGLGLSGCAPDPLDPQREALAAYARGVDALEGGDAPAAVVQFGEALQLDPTPELHLWRARALAAAGDLDGAVAGADAALEMRPDSALARYNRGCWRLRQGLTELAWGDIQAALASGQLDPLAVAQDPDLDPLRADPRFADRVPAAALPAVLSVDAGPRFLRDDWVLRVEAVHAPDQPLELEGLLPVPAPPLSPRRMVQTRTRQGGLARSAVELNLRVEGAFEGQIGPFTARAGALSKSLEAQPVELLAPEGHLAPALPPLAFALRTPEAIFARVAPDTAAREEGWLLVRGLPGDTLSWLGQPEVVFTAELREGPAPVWLGWAAWSEAPLGATLRRGAQEVLNLPPEPP